MTNNYENETKSNSCTSVSIDVTKIVKYSCISSVLIVLIIFTSKTLKSIFTRLES